MDKKRVQGVVRHYRIPGSTGRGYRPVWDAGLAGNVKKRTRIKGVNRPST